jgi:hypothetical protein
MMMIDVNLENVETVEEFLARGNKIKKSEKVLGSKSLNLFSRYSANYRGGSGKTRMGKNGSGKARMSEAYTNFEDLAAN